MPFLRKKGPRKFLRLYVASDVHGSTRCFRKLLNAAPHYEAQALVLAGDLTGKLVVPIEELGDGRWRSNFLGIERTLEGEEALAEHERVIEDAGSYAYRVSPAELEALEGDREAVDKIFMRLVKERIQAWVELAEQRLSDSGIPLYVIPGNDDFPEIDPLFAGFDAVHYIDGRVARLEDGREIGGLGVSNVTPWHAPRDLSEETIAERLGALNTQFEEPEKAVVVIHVPPRGTSIDVVVELDENLRPTGSGNTKVHAGSQAVRDYIQDTQPTLALHGHIHESRGVDFVGKTPCMNAGSEYGEGILRGIVVNLGDDGVAGHLFVSG